MCRSIRDRIRRPALAAVSANPQLVSHRGIEPGRLDIVGSEQVALAAEALEYARFALVVAGEAERHDRKRGGF
jgi:hypothetical protein